MKCMRCGTAITTKDVFCENCLEDMKRHPIDPSTPIQLPNRDEEAPVKGHYRKTRKPEETVVFQRGVILWLVIVVLALAISLGMTLSILIQGQETKQTPETPAAYSAVLEECFT